MRSVSVFTATAIAVALSVSSAAAASFSISWTGVNGYTMEGMFSFDDSLLGTGVITESEIDSFFIEGFLNGNPIGSFTLDPMALPTFWNVNFDTDSLSFPVGSISSGPSGQQWNMSGAGTGCGSPGFGSNAGSGAQDSCIDNVFITDSITDQNTVIGVERIAAAVPLPASFLLLGGAQAALAVRRRRA